MGLVSRKDCHLLCKGLRQMTYIHFEEATNLGNWLFQLGYAKTIRPSDDVAYLVRSEMAERKIERYRELYPWLKVVKERFPACQDGVLRGLFQDIKLLDEGRVRELFRMPKRVRSHIQERYADVLDKDLVVGVSVRRGDYLSLPHRHPFVGTSYLKRTIRSFDLKAVYIVCSDDIPWCKKTLPRLCPERRFVFIENEDVLTQLYIHTLCHHNICSNSTFSWWGAYLNENKGKRVLMPSMWYGIALKNEDWSGLVYEGCELVKNRYTLVMWIHAVLLVCKTRIGDFMRKVGLR